MKTTLNKTKQNFKWFKIVVIAKTLDMEYFEPTSQFCRKFHKTVGVLVEKYRKDAGLSNTNVNIIYLQYHDFQTNY